MPLLVDLPVVLRRTHVPATSGLAGGKAGIEYRTLAHESGIAIPTEHRAGLLPHGAG